MPRLSPGCLRCRQRRVRCDLGRPSCQRCVSRGELCEGYRDELDLTFRHENPRVVSKIMFRFGLGLGMGAGHGGTNAPDSHSSSSTSPQSSSLSPPHPSPPQSQQQDARAVSAFLEKYAGHPFNMRSAPVFLEFLPSLFRQANVDGRWALRWAVQAAAFADAAAQAEAEPPAEALVLGQRALECYGRALTALGASLGEKGKVPDDHDLMTVVVLDIFETLFVQDAPRGAHTQGMAHILRLRGHEQFHDPRGWGLFCLAHHRVQKEQLVSQMGTVPAPDVLLDELNGGTLQPAQLERDVSEMARICQRGRDLAERLGRDDELQHVQDQDILRLVGEMRVLDEAVVSWRQGSEWSFRTVPRSALSGDADLVGSFPETIQLHADLWSAYEWNYHRTARILMHEQLLVCLRRAGASAACSCAAEADALGRLQRESVAMVRSLADEILATVPQSFGDVDHAGRVLVTSVSGPPPYRAIGAYLLLWPAKILKNAQHSVTEAQRVLATRTFERIREFTGMKAQLGALSSI